MKTYTKDTMVVSSRGLGKMESMLKVNADYLKSNKPVMFVCVDKKSADEFKRNLKARHGVDTKMKPVYRTKEFIQSHPDLGFIKVYRKVIAGYELKQKSPRNVRFSNK